MAIQFPTDLDNLTNPQAVDYQNSPSHYTQHSNINDAVEAIEAKIGKDNSADTGSIDYKINHVAGAFGIFIDGQESIIQAGIQGDFVVPFNCIITGHKILADVAGDIVIDVWKSDYANFPPVLGGTIWGGSKPTLSGADKEETTGLTIALSAGDILRYNVDSADVLTRINLSIQFTRSL